MGRVWGTVGRKAGGPGRVPSAGPAAANATLRRALREQLAMNNVCNGANGDVEPQMCVLNT